MGEQKANGKGGGSHQPRRTETFPAASALLSPCSVRSRLSLSKPSKLLGFPSRILWN